MQRSLFALVTMMLMGPAIQARDSPQWLGPDREGIWREDGLVEKFLQGGPKVR